MLELTIISDSGQPVRRVELSPGRSYTLGRSREADVVIAAAMVSRQHAEIECLEGVWILRDLGSTHGCLVDDHRVQEILIRPGIEVRIGPARLRFDNLASRIGKELDELLEEDEAQSGPVQIEIIGLEGRKTAEFDETLMG